ncbi:hypothetical protein PR048_018641 [Dryococelus australis]|uniref:Uncharacterized protein n=1 Tax=Dryococelus australis TaxID=614101 RepID=A0ABQ9HCW3_9NEOP|nr:hypothetical protein PR048_018641 [Dryococelus australis]
MKNRNKDEHGRTVSWLEIKCLRFEKQRPGAIIYRPCYLCQKRKKEYLLRLCLTGVIPAELNAWYESLPTSVTARTCTPEPADDEEGENDERKEDSGFIKTIPFVDFTDSKSMSAGPCSGHQRQRANTLGESGWRQRRWQQVMELVCNNRPDLPMDNSGIDEEDSEATTNILQAN